MVYKIRVLPLAGLELDEIDRYLTENYPGKAKRFFKAFLKQRDRIRKHPFMFRAYEDFPPYRMAPVLDYIAFYIVNEETKVVEIHRILWGEMDLPNRLNEG